MNHQWDVARRQFGWTVWYCKVDPISSVGDCFELYAITSGRMPNKQDMMQSGFDTVMTVFETLCDDRIKEYAEDGKVAYIESGRDCDCVEYDGHVRIVDATLAAYKALDEEIGEWADGPYHLRLCRVSETLDVRQESRDLAMEAYENGNRHSVVSRFP